MTLPQHIQGIHITLEYCLSVIVLSKVSRERIVCPSVSFKNFIFPIIYLKTWYSLHCHRETKPLWFAEKTHVKLASECLHTKTVIGELWSVHYRNSYWLLVVVLENANFKIFSTWIAPFCRTALWRVVAWIINSVPDWLQYSFLRPCELETMQTDVFTCLNRQNSDMLSFERCRHFLKVN